MSDNIIENWKHKDEWRREGKDFSVVVSRHTSAPIDLSSGCYDEEGPNRWCIYVYFYPKHPKFSQFINDNMWQEATEIGFHGGCSFFRRHVDSDGKQTSIQIGCDYHHLHDWSYTQYATAKDARSVFADAEEIFENMQSLAAPLTEKPKQTEAV